MVGYGGSQWCNKVNGTVDVMTMVHFTMVSNHCSWVMFRWLTVGFTVDEYWSTSNGL